MIGGENGLTAIGAQLFVASVVKEDHIATADLFLNFSFNYIRGWGVPIVAGDVPHDGLQSQAARNAQNGWAAAAERRAEKVRVLADCVLKGFAAVREFTSDFVGALERQ